MREVRIVPASEATWEDLQAVFGSHKVAQRCACQWFKTTTHNDWRGTPADVRRESLREQTGCGQADAEETSGLVAFVDGEPAGWVAVEPRVNYPRLKQMRTPWMGRHEDKEDDGVWAVTCLLIRKEFRGERLSYALVAATIPHARAAGAQALEAYPMVTEPGHEIIWDELYVGPLTTFLAAGFEIVSSPSTRRRVVRIDF